MNSNEEWTISLIYGLLIFIIQQANIILGSDEIKPIQIIASCSSERFRDAMTDIDIEQLLLSMNKS